MISCRLLFVTRERKTHLDPGVAGARRDREMLRFTKRSSEVMCLPCSHQFITLGLARGLARLAPFPLGRFFVVAVTLHVAREPFTLTQAFEAF